MRIALLSFEYPPETGFGGIGTYTWHHARALVGLGHEVHVLAGATSATELRTTEHDGVRVHRYWRAGRLMRAVDGLGRMRLWWTRQRLQNALSMYDGLARLARAHRFDVIEMPECGAEGGLVNLRTDAPTVVRLHSPSALIMPFYDVRRADVACCSAIERFAIDRATALSSCSAFLAGEARQHMRVRRPIRVISNGIDLDWFDAQDDDGTSPLPAGRPTILFSGRLERRKGIHLCGEIAASILARHDVVLAFAGDDLFGHLERDVMAAVRGRTLRGSVVALGKLGLREVRACLRRADIVLMPSVWENCPYSCLEAMAAGRAIVASNQGGMPELIRDGDTGLLAETGSAASFVERLDRLLGDDALRARLGRAARIEVEREHSAVHIARLSAEFYQGCGARTPALRRAAPEPAVESAQNEGRAAT